MPNNTTNYTINSSSSNTNTNNANTNTIPVHDQCCMSQNGAAPQPPMHNVPHALPLEFI
jgi:hypothetical protein